MEAPASSLISLVPSRRLENLLLHVASKEHFLKPPKATNFLANQPRATNFWHLVVEGMSFIRGKDDMRGFIDAREGLTGDKHGWTWILDSDF